MNYRKLGKSNIEVSEIGFGTWAIGGDSWGHVEDSNSISAMEKALDLGVNFIDTADVYGSGHSETLVAKVMKGKRDQVILATKGGLMGHHRDPKGQPVYDRPDKVIETFEASLRRLGTDYIDVYFCHISWSSPRETEAFLKAYEQLKQAGKLRLAGVSTNVFDNVKPFNQNGELDIVQLDYSLLNRSAEKEMLPYLQERNIGVVVRGPLKMGVLSGKFTTETIFPEDDVRRKWEKSLFQNNVEKVELLRPLERDNQSLVQLALRFVLDHPAVSTAIPGAKTPEQVVENAGASIRPLLSGVDLELINEVMPV